MGMNCSERGMELKFTVEVYVGDKRVKDTKNLIVNSAVLNTIMVEKSMKKTAWVEYMASPFGLVFFYWKFS